MLPPDDFPDVASIRDAWGELEGRAAPLRRELRMRQELARVYQYAMLNGEPAESTFGEMVQHVANHGSYHRGQVTTMLRQLGAKPAEKPRPDSVFTGCKR